MSIAPVAAVGTPLEARPAVKQPIDSPSASQAPSSEAVSVSPSLATDVRALLDELSSAGLVITHLNEDGARATAEDTKAALSGLATSIANADPAEIARLFGS